jgi:hypothetical protein
MYLYCILQIYCGAVVALQRVMYDLYELLRQGNGFFTIIIVVTLTKQMVFFSLPFFLLILFFYIKLLVLLYISGRYIFFLSNWNLFSA